MANLYSSRASRQALFASIVRNGDRVQVEKPNGVLAWGVARHRGDHTLMVEFEDMFDEPYMLPFYFADVVTRAHPILREGYTGTITASESIPDWS